MQTQMKVEMIKSFYCQDVGGGGGSSRGRGGLAEAEAGTDFIIIL